MGEQICQICGYETIEGVRKCPCCGGKKWKPAPIPGVDDVDNDETGEEWKGDDRPDDSGY